MYSSTNLASITTYVPHHLHHLHHFHLLHCGPNPNHTLPFL